MKIRYSLILLFLSCSCTKVGSNEWAHLNYATPKCGKSGSMVVGNGC